MHTLPLCALCTMPQGFMGQKEFISVTGDISTYVFDKGGSVKTSAPLLLFPSFLAQKDGAGCWFVIFIFSADSK